MLKKIFKIMVFVIAIWVSIIAEESSVPNTIITENPEREVTTVESLPTRDKAKLSLTVNKVEPEEIMGIYNDGTLEVYLEAKSDEGKAQLKSRDIKNMSLKAYSGVSGADQLAKISKTRDRKNLKDLILKTEASKEKKIEIVEKDENGVRLAIRDVKEGEKVYISVMNGKNVVKSYRIGSIDSRAISGQDCWGKTSGTLKKKVYGNSSEVIGYNGGWVNWHNNSQIFNARGIISGITEIAINKYPKVGDILTFQDDYFSTIRELKVTSPKSGNGFRMVGVKNSHLEKLGKFNEIFIKALEAKIPEGGTLSDEYIDSAYGNKYQYQEEEAIDFLFKGGSGLKPGEKARYNNFTYFKGFDFVTHGVSDENCQEDDIYSNKNLMADINIGFNFGVDLGKNNSTDKDIPGVYTYSKPMSIKVTQTNKGSKTVDTEYLVDIGSTTEVESVIELYSITAPSIINHSQDFTYGLSFMKKSGEFTNGDKNKYRAGIWYNNTLLINGNTSKDNFNLSASEGSGSINVKVSQEQENFATLLITPNNVSYGSKFVFTLIQGREVDGIVRVIRKVKYTVAFPKIDSSGDITLTLDPRLKQIASTDMNNGSWVTPSKRFGGWDNSTKKDYPNFIDVQGEFKGNFNISDVEKIEGKTKESGNGDYALFKGEGASRAEIAIKKNVNISNLKDNSNLMLAPEKEDTYVTIFESTPATTKYISTIKLQFVNEVTENGYTGNGVVDLSNATKSTGYFYNKTGTVIRKTQGGNLTESEKENLKMKVNNSFINSFGLVNGTISTNIMDNIEITSKGIKEKINAQFNNGYVEVTVQGKDNINKLKVRINGSNELMLSKEASVFDFTGENKLTIKYKYKDVVLGTFELEVKSARAIETLGTIDVNVDARMRQLANGWVKIGDKKTLDALENGTTAGPYDKLMVVTGSFNVKDNYKNYTLSAIESINGQAPNETKGIYKKIDGNKEAAYPLGDANKKLTVSEFIDMSSANSKLLFSKNSVNDGNNNVIAIAGDGNGEEIALSGNIKETYTRKYSDSSNDGEFIGQVYGEGNINLVDTLVGTTYDFTPGGTGALKSGDVTLNITKGNSLDTTTPIYPSEGNIATYISINDNGWKNHQVSENGGLYDILNGAVQVGISSSGGLSIKKVREESFTNKQIEIQTWYIPNNGDLGSDRSYVVRLGTFKLTLSNEVVNLSPNNEVKVKVDNRIAQQINYNWIRLKDQSIGQNRTEKPVIGNYEGLIKVEGNFNNTDNGAVIDDILTINGEGDLGTGGWFEYTKDGVENEAAYPFKNGSGNLKLETFKKLDDSSLHIVSKKSGNGTYNNQNKFTLKATLNGNSKVYIGNIQEEYPSINKDGINTDLTGFTYSGNLKAGSLRGKGEIDLSNAIIGQKYEFNPSSDTITVNGVKLTMSAGRSLDTTSAVGEKNKNVANGIVFKSSTQDWNKPPFTTNGKILDKVNGEESIEIGLTDSGGFYIKKLKNVNIDMIVNVEAYHFADGITATNNQGALQLSVFEFRVTSLKSDLETVEVEIDDRLAQITNNSWINLGDKTLRSVENVKLGNYSDFINIEDNFTQDGNYRATDTISQVRSLNGMTNFVNLGSDENYKKANGKNETAIPIKDNSGKALTIGEFIKLDNSSRLKISRYDLKASEHNGENKFVFLADRTEGNVTKKVEYSGNIQEQYIGTDGTVRVQIEDSSTTYDKGEGSLNLIGLGNQKFTFPTSANNNQLVSTVGNETATINLNSGKPLNTAGRVTNTTASLATNIRATIGNGGNGNVITANGNKGSEILADLTNKLPLKVGVSIGGGLVVEKTDDTHVPETTLKIEAFYSPTNSLNSGNHIKLGEFTLNVKNIIVSLGETSFTVDRRIGEIVSEGEWLFSDGTLKNSQGVVVGKFPKLVSTSVKAIRLAEEGTTKVTDVTMIDDKAPAGNYTGGNVKYKYTITGNKKVALPYGDKERDSVTLNDYNVENPGNKMVISTKDLDTNSVISTRRVTRDIKADTKVESTFTSRTKEQRYTGSITENYVGSGVYSGSGTITFEEKDKGVTYTFSTTHSGNTATATGGEKPLNMTSVSGNLPNGLSAISSGNIANHIEIETKKQTKDIKETKATTTVTKDGVTFGISNDGGLTIKRENNTEIDNDVTYTIKFYYASEDGNNSKVLLSTFDLTLKPSERVLGDLIFEIDNRYSSSKRNWLTSDGKGFIGFSDQGMLDYSPLVGKTSSDYAKEVRGKNISEVTISESAISGVPDRGEHAINGTTYSYHYTGTDIGENAYQKESAVPKGIKFKDFVAKAIISKHNIPAEYTHNNFIITGSDGIKYSGNIQEEYKGNSEANTGTGTLAMDSMLLDGVYSFAPGIKNPTGQLDPNSIKNPELLKLVKEIKIITENSLDPRGRVKDRTDKNIANKIVLTSKALAKEMVLLNNRRTTSSNIEVPLQEVPNLLVAMGIDENGNLVIKKTKHKPINHKVTIEYYYTPNSQANNSNGDILLGTFDLTLTNTINEVDLGTKEFKIDERLINHLGATKTTRWYRGDKKVIENSTASKFAYDNFIISPDYEIDEAGIILPDDIILKEEETSLEVKDLTLAGPNYKGSENKIAIPLGGANYFKYNLAISTAGMTVEKKAPIYMEFTTKRALYKGTVTRVIADNYHESAATLNLAGIPAQENGNSTGGYDTWASETEGEATDKNQLFTLKFENGGKLFNMNSLDGTKGIVTQLDVEVLKTGEKFTSTMTPEGRSMGTTLNINKGTTFDGAFPKREGNSTTWLQKTKTNDLTIEIVKSDKDNTQLLKITKLSHDVMPKDTKLRLTVYSGEIVLGKLDLTIVNEPIDIGEAVFEIDSRFKNSGPSWLTMKEEAGGRYTITAIAKGGQTIKGAYYSGLFNINSDGLKNIDSSQYIDRVLTVEDRDYYTRDTDEALPGYDLDVRFFMFEKGVSSGANDEFALPKNIPLNKFRENLLTSKWNSNLGESSQDNTFYILGADWKIYKGNLKEKYVGDKDSHGTGTIDLSRHNDLDSNTTYIFEPKATGVTVEGIGNSDKKITMTLGESGNIISGLGRVSGHIDTNLAKKIEVVNTKTEQSIFGDTQATVDNITFGISSSGGLTIKGLNKNIIEETMYKIRFYAKPLKTEGTTIEDSDLRVQLYEFDLYIKPYAKPMGTVEVKADVRAKQLADNYEWLAKDGSVYNSSGVEEGNYSELVVSKHTPPTQTNPSESIILNPDDKVTGVYKIEEKNSEERTVKGYKFGVPKGQTSGSSNKIALPYSGTNSIFMKDYIDNNNLSSKFVISTKNIDVTRAGARKFIIGATDNKNPVKYEGYLQETYVNQQGTTIVPVDGYSGSGNVDVTSLMISKVYTYAPGGTSTTINPKTIDGIVTQNTNLSGVISEHSGVMVDARGLFDKNKDKNIATKVIITAKSNGETQVLRASRGRTVGIDPVPITAGALDGAIALGISPDGGLIIKKLDEKFSKKEIVDIKYVYDVSNDLSKSGIVLGTYTLKITNNVEPVGSFTTEVDPRVLQQRKDNNVFWIHTGANIGSDPLANLENTNNNAPELIKTQGTLTKEINFSATDGITYVGNGVRPPQYSQGNKFKRFEENGKAILGIKNDVANTNTLKTNTAFATYNGDGVKSYNIPIIIKETDGKNYKLGTILEYVKDNGRDIPIDGYRGKGILKLEEALKNVVYDFAPKGTSVTKDSVTLNITTPTDEIMPLNNTMLDSSGKVDSSGNIANMMKITVGNETPVIINENNLTYKVVQKNENHLAGDGEIEVGINSKGGLSIKKITNGDFDKRVKIEYIYKFNKNNNTPIEIKLGEVELHIINEVIDLGTIDYNIDGRYYIGAVNRDYYTWLYPDGRASKGLEKNNPYFDYKKDTIFNNDSTKFNTSAIVGTPTVYKVIEVEDRSHNKGNFTGINNTSYTVFGSNNSNYENESAVPNGTNLQISTLATNMLGALNNPEQNPLLENIYYILGNDKKIYVGNVRENIVGASEILTGSGRVDITNIERDVLHVFEAEDKNSRIENPVVVSNNKLKMSYTGYLLDGRGRVGEKNGKTIANKIKLTNISYRGKNEGDVTLVGGTTVRIQNVEIGIDSETGGLTIKKLSGRGGIPENSGGLAFDIEYYYDPSENITQVGEGAVKLGVFRLDVLDYYFEIEGNNKVDFGKMTYGGTTDNNGVQRVVEFFNVKNIYNKKIEFSLKENPEGYFMYHTGNKIDSKTDEIAKIPLDIKVKNYAENQFGVDANAHLTKDTPVGSYKGTIEITVTITDGQDPLK